MAPYRRWVLMDAPERVRGSKDENPTGISYAFLAIVASFGLLTTVGASMLLTSMVFANEDPAGDSALQEPPRLLPFFEEAGGVSNPWHQTTTATWMDTGDRESVIQAFVHEFSKVEPPVEWEGNHQACDGGSSSELLRQATLERVNFYRAMAGVPGIVTENSDYSSKAQAGAIMMSAEGKLSHSPSSDYECYTDTGFEAASNSNLYLGRTGAHAIDGYMEDPGPENIDVGHRNTILHPPTEFMGVANVEGVGPYDDANLLWVFDDNVFDSSVVVRESEGFVAWPPSGNVPQEVIYPRWSFSLVDADFANATVTMTSDGAEVPLEIVEIDGRQGRVPNPIIVWEPTVEVGAQQQGFEITIGGVKTGDDVRDFTYSVVVMEPLLADG